MGVGDRFGRQGAAQLAAFLKARSLGVEVAPVWNKSNREHVICGTTPDSVRTEADSAVRKLGWNGAYFVDADHVGLKTVDPFLKAGDFFTLDVADFIGKPADEDAVRAFAGRYSRYAGELKIPGTGGILAVTPDDIGAIARKYLLAVREAGAIYRRISASKGQAPFVIEVSMDEADSPQSPVEMLFILAAIAEEKIPAQTIAPKFTGRFNKGVDYVGDIPRFESEFRQDIAVLAFAAAEFGLPADLKLSVHSGSDKYSLYRPIRRALKAANAGVHLKTAGTTWLEEVCGLARSGGDGLKLAAEIYREALNRYDEMVAPYTAVIDIDRGKLPTADAVDRWTAGEFTTALRHDRRNPGYNPHFRQLVHVGYKVAAGMGTRYLEALDRSSAVIGPCVTGNIFDRHLKPVFIDK